MGQSLSPEVYREFLRRGWRRCGTVLFRPACPACTQCRSLRVPVDQHTLTKSQRRNLRANPDITLTVQAPTVSQEHINLFNSYHADMTARRGWPARELTADEYYQTYLEGESECAREFLYRRDDTLVGVGLVDEVSDATSSVYFFHDPEWRDEGPGTFSMLAELDWAKSQKKSYHYLGYWIAACQSMSYKNRFRPYELLREHVDNSVEPIWEPIEIGQDA